MYQHFKSSQQKSQKANKGDIDDVPFSCSLFDLYTPMANRTAKNIVSTIEAKADEQVERVIVHFAKVSAADFPAKRTEVIQIINNNRAVEVGGFGVRQDMQELWIITPDGVIEKLFPNGGIK